MRRTLLATALLGGFFVPGAQAALTVGGQHCAPNRASVEAYLARGHILAGLYRSRRGSFDVLVSPEGRMVFVPGDRGRRCIATRMQR